jgi:tetratricopeptide (TPR) repeat protein
LKRSEIRALADEAYTILDDSLCEAAVERALQVLANAPNDPESYLLMTEVAEEKDHFDNALLWIERGLLKHPHHEGLLLKKATILVDGFEEIDEAFKILSDIKSRFHNKSLATLKKEIGGGLLLDIYLLLIDCFRLKANFQQALAHAQVAKEIAPFDENVLLALATANFELGNYDDAETMIEPIDRRSEKSDFYWLKAQIACARGRFSEADAAFARAFKENKARYHRPVRLNKECFVTAFDQALMALPKEIRELIRTAAVKINDVIPIDLVKDSGGHLSPQSCITIEPEDNAGAPGLKVISIYQKNIENIANKKEEIKDVIASALLHELGKLAV